MSLPYRYSRSSRARRAAIRDGVCALVLVFAAIALLTAPYALMLAGY